MPFERHLCSGTLFHNRNKKDAKHPDLKGDALIEIDGVQYPLEIAPWTRQSERFGKFLSLSIELKSDRDFGRAPTLSTALMLLTWNTAS
jgi:hypothetical protein